MVESRYCNRMNEAGCFQETPPATKCSPWSWCTLKAADASQQLTWQSNHFCLLSHTSGCHRHKTDSVLEMNKDNRWLMFLKEYKWASEGGDWLRWATGGFSQIRPFRAIQLPSSPEETWDDINFDYIKVDESKGGDGCKQGHYLRHYLTCGHIFHNSKLLLINYCRNLPNTVLWLPATTFILSEPWLQLVTVERFLLLQIIWKLLTFRASPAHFILRTLRSWQARYAQRK